MSVPRRTLLYKGDFTRYEFTVGCPGCIWMQLGQGPRRNHSDECRRRMEEELAKTEEGRQRIARANERIDHWVADQTQDDKNDDAPPGDDAGAAQGADRDVA